MKCYYIVHRDALGIYGDEHGLDTPEEAQEMIIGTDKQRLVVIYGEEQPPEHDIRCPQNEVRLTSCSVATCTATLVWPWPWVVALPCALGVLCAEHVADCPELGITPVLVLPEAEPCQCEELDEGDREQAALERWERRSEEQEVSTYWCGKYACDLFPYGPSTAGCCTRATG